MNAFLTAVCGVKLFDYINIFVVTNSEPSLDGPAISGPPDYIQLGVNCIAS